jgi:hypothetical protein
MEGFAGTEGCAKVSDAGGENRAMDDTRARRQESGEVEDAGTERLLPEAVDENLTDLLFGDVASLNSTRTSPHAD